MRSELAVLLLLAVSGAAGLITSNVAITATMFVGGFTTWLFLTLPDYLKAVKAAPQAELKQQAGQQEADGKKVRWRWAGGRATDGGSRRAFCAARDGSQSTTRCARTSKRTGCLVRQSL